MAKFMHEPMLDEGKCWRMRDTGRQFCTKNNTLIAQFIYITTKAHLISTHFNIVYTDKEGCENDDFEEQL